MTDQARHQDPVHDRLVRRAHHYLTLVGTKLDHIQRLGPRQPQALSLSDGVTVDAAMRSQPPPRAIDDLAGDLAQPFRQEAAVVTVRDEADVLALRSVVDGQAPLPRAPAGGVLGQIAQREDGAPQQSRWDFRQDVGLILLPVGAAQQMPLAVGAGVVTRGDAGQTQPVGQFGQGGEAQARVAADAGVRRTGLPIGRHERLHHLAVEVLGEVDREVGQPKLMGQTPGLEHGLG